MPAEGATLELTRSIGGSRDAVWRAWTDPAELNLWWWPARLQTTYVIDARPGGAYRFKTADIPDMGVLDLSGKFLQVDRPEHLSYTFRWNNDTDGETRVDVRFRELTGDQTEVRLRHEGFPDDGERDNHITGWNDCLDRLEARFRDPPE